LVADAALVVELSLDRLGEQANRALGGEHLVAPCPLWSEVPSVGLVALALAIVARRRS